MSARLRTAAAIVGGTLTALAVPAAAHAATRPASPRPGLTDPNARAVLPRPGAAAHSKATVPDASCGNGTVTWQDKYDNRYLEIYHSGKANGNWADAYTGNGTCTQKWFAVASGSTTLSCDGGARSCPMYGMVNTNSDKCLAAPTTNIGNAHVVQESCGHNSYNYKWEEISEKGGWGLVEVVDNGTFPSSLGKVVAACEDTANHYIYTSHWYNAYGVNNCIWH